MPASSCVKCGHTSFEIAESAIAGLRFKRDFVQCSQCGGVIGVVEADNLNARLDAIEERLKGMVGDRQPARSSLSRAQPSGRKHLL